MEKTSERDAETQEYGRTERNEERARGELKHFNPKQKDSRLLKAWLRSGRWWKPRNRGTELVRILE